MQETDFPATDGFAPLDPPILLGLDPMLLVALVLLLLAVGAAMYLFGRRSGGQERGPDDAPAQIHAAILKSSRAAMAADSNDLRGRVQALRDLIERLLGPVLVLNKGLSGALKDMDAALKGEIKDDHGHGGDHGGGHGSDHSSGHHKASHDDHHATAPGPAGGGSAAAASSTIAVIGHPIHIHTAPEPAPAHPPHASHGETRKMTHEEQTSALALSVRKFNDYWSKSDLRVRELRAARDALSRRPPADIAKASDTRVWDRH